MRSEKGSLHESEQRPDEMRLFTLTTINCMIAMPEDLYLLTLIQEHSKDRSSVKGKQLNLLSISNVAWEAHRSANSCFMCSGRCVCGHSLLWTDIQPLEI